MMIEPQTSKASDEVTKEVATTVDPPQTGMDNAPVDNKGPLGKSVGGDVVEGEKHVSDNPQQQQPSGDEEKVEENEVGEEPEMSRRMISMPEVTESAKPSPPPVFTCHEATYVPNKILTSKKQKSTLWGANESSDEDLSGDEFFPQASDRKNYAKHYPTDNEYRPAAMSPFPVIIQQVVRLVHSELAKHGCQRLLPEKAKPATPNEESQSHHKKRESHLKLPHENMERKMHRLKIYKRAFGSLVIYFRSYSPLLLYIKKTYDDVLSFRLRQFKQAQHEKLRIYHERASLEHKMMTYKFPDFKRLKKSEQHLNLLYVRIRKQDEAIEFITEILRKMERSLSDHYEKYRDMEDQIKLLDIELTELTQRSMIPKKFEVQESEDNNGDDEVPAFLKSMDDDDEEEPIDENEEIDEDKRMVLILAYAVCTKDLEEAHRKLKLYEKKYQLQQLKKRLLQGRMHGGDEEDALEGQPIDDVVALGENSEDEAEEGMSDEEEEEDEDDEEEDEENDEAEENEFVEDGQE